MGGLVEMVDRLRAKLGKNAALKTFESSRSFVIGPRFI